MERVAVADGVEWINMKYTVCCSQDIPAECPTPGRADPLHLDPNQHSGRLLRVAPVSRFSPVPDASTARTIRPAYSPFGTRVVQADDGPIRTCLKKWSVQSEIEGGLGRGLASEAQWT